MGLVGLLPSVTGAPLPWGEQSLISDLGHTHLDFLPHLFILVRRAWAFLGNCTLQSTPAPAGVHGEEKSRPGTQCSCCKPGVVLTSHAWGHVVHMSLVASFHDLQGKGCFTPQRHRACFRTWCIVVSRKFLEKQVSKHEEETTTKIKERKKQPGSKGSF